MSHQPLHKCPRCGQPVLASLMDAHLSGQCSGAEPSEPRSSGSKGGKAGGNTSGCGCCLFVAILLVLGIGSCNSGQQGGSNEPQAPAASGTAAAPAKPELPSSVDLNAGVAVRDGRVYITNNDTFDYVDLRLELNPGVFSGGWQTTHPLIIPGHTIDLPLWRFTKGDGERFDAFRYEVKNLAIHCNTKPNHGRGNYYGGYN